MHLSEVYQNQAQYCIIFASREYAEKNWTSHERPNAQAHALPRCGKSRYPIVGYSSNVGVVETEWKDIFVALLAQYLSLAVRLGNGIRQRLHRSFVRDSESNWRIIIFRIVQSHYLVTSQRERNQDSLKNRCRNLGAQFGSSSPRHSATCRRSATT